MEAVEGREQVYAWEAGYLNPSRRANSYEGIANTFVQLFHFRASAVIASSRPIPLGLIGEGRAPKQFSTTRWQARH